RRFDVLDQALRAGNKEVLAGVAQDQINRYVAEVYVPAFTDEAAAGVGLPDDRELAAMVDFTIRSGRVPTELRGRLLHRIMSPGETPVETRRAIATVELVNQLGSNPLVRDQRGAAYEKAQDVRLLVDSGKSPSQAISMVAADARLDAAGQRGALRSSSVMDRNRIEPLVRNMLRE